MKITVKRIETAEEMELAHQIRKRVFVEEQGVSLREEIDEHEDESSHILAMVNNMSAGTARWRSTSKGLKLERFAVLKEYRNSGVGRALVDYCLQENKDAPHLYLNAQVTVIEFYRKFGFSEIGKEFMEAGIVHKRMVLTP